MSEEVRVYQENDDVLTYMAVPVRFLSSREKLIEKLGWTRMGVLMGPSRSPSHEWGWFFRYWDRSVKRS